MSSSLATVGDKTRLPSPVPFPAPSPSLANMPFEIIGIICDFLDDDLDLSDLVTAIRINYAFFQASARKLWRHFDLGIGCEDLYSTNVHGHELASIASPRRETYVQSLNGLHIHLSGKDDEKLHEDFAFYNDMQPCGFRELTVSIFDPGVREATLRAAQKAISKCLSLGVVEFTCCFHVEHDTPNNLPYWLTEPNCLGLPREFNVKVLNMQFVPDCGLAVQALERSRGVEAFHFSAIESAQRAELPCAGMFLALSKLQALRYLEISDTPYPLPPPRENLIKVKELRLDRVLPDEMVNVFRHISFERLTSLQVSIIGGEANMREFASLIHQPSTSILQHLSMTTLVATSYQTPSRIQIIEAQSLIALATKHPMLETLEFHCGYEDHKVDSLTDDVVQRVSKLIPNLRTIRITLNPDSEAGQSLHQSFEKHFKNLECLEWMHNGDPNAR